MLCSSLVKESVLDLFIYDIISSKAKLMLEKWSYMVYFLWENVMSQSVCQLKLWNILLKLQVFLFYFVPKS